MSQSHCELWVHLIWTTKNREPWLKKGKRHVLIKHIRSFGDRKDYHIDIVNGIEDHLHTLVAFKSFQKISRIVNDIKGESSHWINEENLFQLDHLFRWQGGYAAFTIGPKNVKRIRKYILNQESHHQGFSLEQELERLNR